MDRMSLWIGSLLVSNVPGGRRVFTSLLVVVPLEGWVGRGTRHVNKTSVRTSNEREACCARLVVSVGLACAVADAVAASTNDDTSRCRGSRLWGSRSRRSRRNSRRSSIRTAVTEICLMTQRSTTKSARNMSQFA